jgi:hypothetical protein
MCSCFADCQALFSLSNICGQNQMPTIRVELHTQMPWHLSQQH